ncbi:PilZ domain-containing protein [Siccirubricoccus deserti]
MLALLLLAGLGVGLHGVLTNPTGSLEFQAFLLNGCWALLSLVPVLASLAVGRERRQVRARSRTLATLPATLLLADGRRLEGTTSDVSLGGASLTLAGGDMPATGEATLELDLGHERVTTRIRVLRAEGAAASSPSRRAPWRRRATSSAPSWAGRMPGSAGTSTAGTARCAPSPRWWAA